MTLRTDIVDRIDAAAQAARDEPPRLYLGASMIGTECSRRLWYQFRLAFVDKFPGRIIRLFDRGHEEEQRIVGWLRSIGLEVVTLDPDTGKQFRFVWNHGHQRGNTDGAVRGAMKDLSEWVLLECKTHNKDSFNDLVKKNVEASCPDHYDQMQTYMKRSHLPGRRGLWRALYIGVCKDDDRIHVEIVEFNQRRADFLDQRGEYLVYSDEPPPKLSLDPSHFACKLCPAHKLCQYKRWPEVNCRTCAHSTPENGGDGAWSCARASADDNKIPEHVQRRGCPQHVFNPHMLAQIASYVGGDQAANYAEFKDATGTFRNGTKAPGVIPSSELVALDPKGPSEALRLAERFADFGARPVAPTPDGESHDARAIYEAIGHNNAITGDARQFPKAQAYYASRSSKSGPRAP